MAALVFKLCENSPEILRDVCLERGWKEYEEDDDEESDWNLWWKSSGFRASDFVGCRPWQRLNHFPKSNSITRKDCLARNLRRMKGVYGNALYNFAPLTFNLPNDYRKFVTQYSKYKEDRRVLWICKPADQSRGKGIFLFRELTDLTYDCATVVQQYIHDPFLIAGYKFDLRLYVLVTSFHPLHIYLYHEGLARFGTDKFDLNSLDNVFSHLTNTSINKLSPFYATDKERIGCGCKWSLRQLRNYFYQHNVDDQLLWHRITAIVILTLLMQAPEVSKSTTNSFELFGFDILIDENLKPWLLEVNFSPSLTVDCTLDITIKKALLQDTLDAINIEESSSSSCAIKNCIKTIGIQKQHRSKRVKAKLGAAKKLNNVRKSCRFYARSSVTSNLSALSSRMSKHSLESVNTDTLPRSDEPSTMNSNIVNTDENSIPADEEKQKTSLSSDHNESIAEEDLGYNGTDSELKESQCSRPDMFTSRSRLFQSNGSVEFRKAKALTKAKTRNQATKPNRHSTSSSVSNKPYSSTHWTPESSIQQDQFAGEKCLTNPAGHKLNKNLQQTTLPPLKRSPKKLIRPFTKRSAKITPYIPVKPQYAPKKLNKFTLLNCSCRHELPGWGSSPSKRVGDYVLIFPFNEVSQKSCSPKQPNYKAAIDEVKKVVQKITHLARGHTKLKSTSVDKSIEKLDLNKPFWGFSLLLNYPSY